MEGIRTAGSLYIIEDRAKIEKVKKLLNILHIPIPYDIPTELRLPNNLPVNFISQIEISTHKILKYLDNTKSLKSYIQKKLDDIKNITRRAIEERSKEIIEKIENLEGEKCKKRKP